MRARARAGGRAHHCATSFMLTLISFITFATPSALPSCPSAAWGARPLRRELPGCAPAGRSPNPSSSDSPSFLLPPDAGAPVIPFTRGHAEPVSFPLNSYVPTPTRVVKGAPNLREGGIDCLNRVREHGGSIIIMQDEQRFPAGQLPRRHL